MRSALSFLAGVALGAGAVLLLGTPSESPEVERAAIHEDRIPPPRPALSPGGAAPPSRSSDDVAVVSPTSAAPTTLAPARIGWIDVRLVDSSGNPVEDANAYALPAGGHGVDSLEECFSSRIGTAIEVEAPGSYDVGARVASAHALREAVEVRAGETVRVDLALPATGTVRFVYDGARVPDGSLQAWLRLDGEEQSNYPGRAQVLSGYSSAHVPTAGSIDVGPVPLGRRLRAGAHIVRRNDVDVPWTVAAEVDRELVSAGDVVRVATRPCGRLRARFTLVPREAWDEAMPLRVVVTDGARKTELPWQPQVDNPQDLQLEVTSGHASVQWSGPTVEPGASSEPIVVPVGATVDAAYEVRPRRRGDGTSVPVALTGVPEALLREHGASFWATGIHGSDPGDRSIAKASYADSGTIPAHWRGAGSVIAVVADRFASEPFQAPLRGGATVALRPTGTLVVLTTWPWLSLRSKERPFLFRVDEWGERTDSAVELSVRPGTLLGLLPEGTHRFEVLRNGVRLGEVEARVLPGRIVPLDLDARRE